MPRLTFPIMAGGAVAIGIIWTCAFDAYWQWLPIGAALATGHIVAKLTRRDP